MDEDAKARGDEIETPSGAADDTAGDAAKAAEAKAAEEAAGKAAADKEAADKAAADKAAADKKTEPMIPKGRFDEAVRKARDEAAVAIKRADELEAQLKASQGEVDAKKVAAEIDALEEELEKAIADGNIEAKKRLRAEIRDKNQQVAESRAAAHAARATAVAIEQIRYDALVNRMEVEHPELDPNHENYNEEQVAEILEFKEAFEAKGMASSAALEKSLKAVYRNGPKPEKKEESDADKKAEAEAKAKAEAEKRTAEAVKRGLEKKDEQPPQTKTGAASDKAGKDADPVKNAHKMGDKEFEKLSEEELKRARGDIV